MAAKKARGWRSGRREGRSRMVQMARHLVVSEGKETEPRYFEGVRAALGAANGQRAEALHRVQRLEAHHGELGNAKPSAQNPATKVGEIFDVMGPYLAAG